MNLTGLHLLLTYQCTIQCDHCFVWGSPWQKGTMSLADIAHILQEGQKIGTVKSIYFEGGEPFLFYATLVQAVQMAVDMGFEVGMVSNGYWATTKEDALIWLRPFVGRIVDLSISSDVYHWNEYLAEMVQNARVAAAELGIPVGTISIAEPESGVETAVGQRDVGQLPLGGSNIMYRGRAVEVLAPQAIKQDWQTFTTCPYENLRDPGRVHVDPLGYLHICQGIAIGNIFTTPLADIIAGFDPDAHPITGPLLAAGPAGLVNQYHLSHEDMYADACHLCYESRVALRAEFPDILAPEQMYGVPD